MVENTVFEYLYSLPGPEELHKEIGANAATIDFKVNAHIHLPPNFSAFESVEHAVRLADEQDVRVLGASNYYDYRVYEDFARLARQHRILPLFGIEIITLVRALVDSRTKINDPGNPGRLYLCGKGITRFEEMTPQARQLIDTIRENDRRRMQQMIELLSSLFDRQGMQMHLEEQDIVERICTRHGCSPDRVVLQERHLAQAFQERFFEWAPEEQRAEKLRKLFGEEPKSNVNRAVEVQGEIRSRLMKSGKSAFVPESFLDFDQGYELVLELGGIPCYPVLADGADPICAFEDPAEALVEHLKEMNIHMAELIPIRNEPEVLKRYVRTLRNAGIAVVAGTEHNTLDLLPMEPACKGAQPIAEDLKAIFREGAAVIAAHQYLQTRGQAGFVHCAGEPNRDFPDAESRLSWFRKLGEKVIQTYIAANRLS